MKRIIVFIWYCCFFVSDWAHICETDLVSWQIFPSICRILAQRIPHAAAVYVLLLPDLHGGQEHGAEAGNADREGQDGLATGLPSPHSVYVLYTRQRQDRTCAVHLTRTRWSSDRTVATPFCICAVHQTRTRWSSNRTVITPFCTCAVHQTKARWSSHRTVITPFCSCAVHRQGQDGLFCSCSVHVLYGSYKDNMVRATGLSSPHYVRVM